jgi:hypothetical protein
VGCISHRSCRASSSCVTKRVNTAPAIPTVCISTPQRTFEKYSGVNYCRSMSEILILDAVDRVLYDAKCPLNYAKCCQKSTCFCRNHSASQYRCAAMYSLSLLFEVGVMHKGIMLWHDWLDVHHTLVNDESCDRRALMMLHARCGVFLI